MSKSWRQRDRWEKFEGGTKDDWKEQKRKREEERARKAAEKMENREPRESHSQTENVN